MSQITSSDVCSNPVRIPITTQQGEKVFVVNSHLCEDWYKNRLLSSGDNGDIFEVCCHPTDCDYVAKVVPYKVDMQDYAFEKMFVDEVTNHYILAQHNIVPAIYDAFLCRETKHGYIIMKKAGISVGRWFDMLTSTNQYTDEQLNEFVTALIPQVEALFHRTNEQGIIHNDINIGNFMVTVNPDNLLQFSGLKLIDMGLSKYVGSHQAAKRGEDLPEVKMTLTTAMANRLKARKGGYKYVGTTSKVLRAPVKPVRQRSPPPSSTMSSSPPATESHKRTIDFTLSSSSKPEAKGQAQPQPQAQPQHQGMFSPIRNPRKEPTVSSDNILRFNLEETEESSQPSFEDEDDFLRTPKKPSSVSSTLDFEEIVLTPPPKTPSPKTSRQLSFLHMQNEDQDQSDQEQSDEDAKQQEIKTLSNHFNGKLKLIHHAQTDDEEQPNHKRSNSKSFSFFFPKTQHVRKLRSYTIPSKHHDE